MNDLTTAQYFRGSNKKNSKGEKFSYLKQILKKRARLEYYRFNSNNKAADSRCKIERDLKKKKLFSEIDLFTVRDLNDIDSFFKENVASVGHAVELDEEIDMSSLEESGNSLEEELADNYTEDLPDDFYQISENEFEETNINNLSLKRKLSDSNISSTMTLEAENEDYICYQIKNVLIMKNDVECCYKKNWLTDTCIYAFMKTYENKGVYVLDYIQTNKFAYEKSEKITNIFPKVITLLFYFYQIIKKLFFY